MHDVMRISEEYFVRMLYESPAVEALSALVNDWTPRSKSELPRFGLATPEYYVTLCLIYTGEVGNGGHSQFFLNRGGHIADEVLLALDAVSLPRARDILLRACAAFLNGLVPSNPDAVDAIIDGVLSSSAQLFGELDRELWAVRIDDVLLNYLRFHANEILLPERGLAGIADD
jgi:Domain of unknown function (DUF4375)